MAITVSVARNAENDALLLGEVVRASDDDAVVRSQGDSAAHAQGTIGVMANPGVVPGTGDSTAAGDSGTVSADGIVYVKLEAQLNPIVGQTLYVSPTIAGAATNVVPVGAGQAVLAIGIITNVSPYVSIGRVLADIDPDLVPTAIPPN